MRRSRLARGGGRCVLATTVAGSRPGAATASSAAADARRPRRRLAPRRTPRSSSIAGLLASCRRASPASPCEPSPDTAAGTIDDAGARRLASAVAVGVVAGAGGSESDDFAVSTVVQLRPGVFSDAVLPGLARRLRRRGLRAGGRRGRADSQQIDRPQPVDVTDLREGAQTYHVAPAGRPARVSITAVGDAQLRRARHGRPAAVAFGPPCRARATGRPDELGRRPPRPRPARHRADLPRLAAGSGPPDAHEQPRPRGRRGPRPPRRLRRDRPGGAVAGPRSTPSSASCARSTTTRRCSSSPASRSASCARTSGRRASSSPTRTSSASGRPGSTSASSRSAA